jgi:putative mycofactocin binding protein MftB
MALRLEKGVQVRKESWGLLFYEQERHRLYFIRSGNWLLPHYFDGTWTPDRLIEDVSGRTRLATDRVELNVRKLTDKLLENGMITHELC